MSVTKRINTGDYTIDTFKYDGNPDGNVTILTHTVTIDGNLVIIGNTANIQAFDTTKQIFQINADLTTGESPREIVNGFENNRGSESNVGLYWHESGTYSGQWVANNAVGNVGPILTSYNVKIDQTTDQPIGESGYVVITGNTPGAGGSGLFVNAGSNSDELVTTTKIRKYGIIFG
jgi:hypothetical protein